MLISDYLPVRKSYFDSNIIARKLRRFFLRIILKRTSTEAYVYMRRHQNAKVKHFDVSNVIYHKFSHGAVSYRLNGKKRLRHVRISFQRGKCNSVTLKLMSESCIYKTYTETVTATPRPRKISRGRRRFSSIFSNSQSILE